MREEQNKRKDTFHVEVETESICPIVSDRTVPQTLSSLNKVDLLLTICQQIPDKHHFSSFTCLLTSDSHVMSYKNTQKQTNKQKPNSKAKAISMQEISPRM